MPDARAERGGAVERVRAVPKVSDVLRITKLDSVLKPYFAEATRLPRRTVITDAVTTPPARWSSVRTTSPDVLAYLRGLLKRPDFASSRRRTSTTD
jgi:hypothetical protein